jgi:hypothetical protein
MELPALVTIPNVELVSVGIEYALLSGPATFTQEDLKDAVSAANDDSAIRLPRLKLGYKSDEHGAPIAEPAFGKADNLRLSEDGMTILCDFVGVPEWLAGVMPVAYPSRSIEAYYGVETVTGHKWRLVITAVALLGVEWPGVSVLADLPLYYGSEIPDGVVVAGLEKGDGRLKVAATLNVDDVRRQYYDSLTTDQAWWWVRAILLDPSVLIVDDDEGQLYRVPFDVSGEAAEFGEPIPVKVEYVDTDEQRKAAALTASKPVAVFATRAESRPDKMQRGGSGLDPKQLRASLDLPEDATDEQVQAKIAELKAATEADPAPGEEDEGEDKDKGEPDPAEGEETPTAAKNGNGTVTIDAAALAALQASAKRGETAFNRQEASDKKETIGAAVKAGKFPPARKEHWGNLWDKDPEGTKEAIAALASGLIPVDDPTGAVDSEGVAGEAYPAEWLPEVAARRADQGAGSTRIHTEG